MKYLISLLIFTLLLACQNETMTTETISSEKTSSFSGAEEVVEQKKDEKALVQPVKSNLKVNRKLIKTGSIQFETENITKTRLDIENLINKHNAFISNELSNNHNYKIETELSIRIPFEKFDLFMNDLSGSVKKFDFKNVKTKDVTAEYIDIQSRLIAKNKLEQSFLELLKKALKIKDIIEIEKELNNVRVDIERMQGRIRLLQDQVSLSTMNIVFYKNHPREYEKEKGFFSKLWYNFQSGFDNLLSIVLNAVSIWPFFILMLGIFFFIKYLLRKNNN